jgi:predicted permease
MIRSFDALRRVAPGFTAPEQIQTVRLSIPEGQVADSEGVVRMQRHIVETIAAIPGVTAVAYATALPMESEFENNVVMTVEGQTYDAGIPPLRRTKSVSPGLFRTLGTPLLAGRDFTWTDIDDHRPVVIVSASMAREAWGAPATALGKRIRMGRAGPWLEVVGVAGDVYDSGVQLTPPTIVYWPAAVQRMPGNASGFVWRAVTLAIRSDRAGSDRLLGQIGAAIWAVNPNLPLARVQTLADVYAQSMSRTSFTLMMLVIAGALALALGLIGIYGVLSYTVSQRRREIGIRLALGAPHQQLRRRFVRHGLALTGIGVALGLAAATALTRVLSSQLFGVSLLDPWTYAAVALVLCASAMLASYIPARRAAAVQPIEALAAE